VESTFWVVSVGLDLIIVAGADWVGDATNGLLIMEVIEVADIIEDEAMTEDVNLLLDTAMDTDELVAGVMEVATEYVGQGTVRIVVECTVWVVSMGVEDIVVTAPGVDPVVSAESVVQGLGLAEVEGS